MTDKECFFVIVCLVNAAISVLYLVWGICVAVPAKNAAQGEENPVLHDNRRAYVVFGNDCCHLSFPDIIQKFLKGRTFNAICRVGTDHADLKSIL